MKLVNGIVNKQNAVVITSFILSADIGGVHIIQNDYQLNEKII